MLSLEKSPEFLCFENRLISPSEGEVLWQSRCLGERETLLIFLALDVGFFSELSMLFPLSGVWGSHFSLYQSIYTPMKPKKNAAFKDV